MPSHKEKRKEKKRKMIGVAKLELPPAPGDPTPPPGKKRKALVEDSQRTHEGGDDRQKPRKAQALGAWNPKATVVKGATLGADEATSLLLFYQYIQPLWSEVVPVARCAA